MASQSAKLSSDCISDFTTDIRAASSAGMATTDISTKSMPFRIRPSSVFSWLVGLNPIDSPVIAWCLTDAYTFCASVFPGVNSATPNRPRSSSLRSSFSTVSDIDSLSFSLKSVTFFF